MSDEREEQAVEAEPPVLTVYDVRNQALALALRRSPQASLDAVMHEARAYALFLNEQDPKIDKPRKEIQGRKWTPKQREAQAEHMRRMQDARKKARKA